MAAKRLCGLLKLQDDGITRKLASFEDFSLVLTFLNSQEVEKLLAPSWKQNTF
jgi:hypothetical protein